MARNMSSEAFARSTEGIYARTELLLMEASPAYNTEATFSPLCENGVKLFSDKHMEYLAKYKKIDPLQYISNLKLMTRTGVNDQMRNKRTV